MRLFAGPPRIWALVVTSPEGQIAGIITERDIILDLDRHGGQLLDRQVCDVM